MKIRVHLSALTRMELTEIIEVPDGTPDYELDHLVRDRWDEAESEDFVEDVEYWERGSCYWEKLNK